MRLSYGGLAVDLPPGWEARARRQPRSRADRPGNLLFHASTVPLPAQRGDFGSGVVERLGADDVFVCLFEHDREDAGSVLFRAQGLPRLRPGDFSSAAMQRVIPGQSGAQFFFRHHGRAYCLYVVLGSHARRAAGAARAAALVAGISLP